MELAQKDEAGNLYIEINNVRITYAFTKEGDKDVLKIQPYKSQPDGANLCKGTEIPINDSDLLTLVGELSLLRKAVHQHTIKHLQV